MPIRFLSFQSDEFQHENYIANDLERCYHCKKIRFAKLVEYASENRKEIVVDGSNFDDLSDFRPGRRVLDEMGIRSPLAELGFRKSLIRDIAREWKLPNSELPPSPCLSTRLTHGLTITEERLRNVEKAEKFLQGLGFCPVRARLHSDLLVRIEVPPAQIPLLSESKLREQIVMEFEKLGFRYISVELKGFHSGSMNPAS